jgi:hypothetical protein
MTVKVHPYGSEATVIDNLQGGDASTDTQGFFGATPIVQPSVTAIGTTTISQVATSGKWAFASSTAALAFVLRVQQLQDKLDALGLVNEG